MGREEIFCIGPLPFQKIKVVSLICEFEKNATLWRPIRIDLSARRFLRHRYVTLRSGDGGIANQSSAKELSGAAEFMNASS